MNKINVTLLHHTPLYIAANGARTCWDSFDKSDTAVTVDEAVEKMCECSDINWVDAESILRQSIIGPKDLELLDRVGNRFHHASILEHISMNFFIDGISRACLQELARHRMASLSVKSTRYTLKELKDEDEFISEDVNIYGDIDNDEAIYNAWYASSTVLRASKYITLTGNAYVDQGSIKALEHLRGLIYMKTSNDIAKYCMPEAYRTQLTWTINLRSLQNFLSLRTDRKALPEIQHLANFIYATLPDDIKLLVKHCVADEITKEKIAEHIK